MPRVVTESTTKRGEPVAFAAAFTESQSRESSPPLLCVTRWTLSTPKLRTIDRISPCSAAALTATGTAPPPARLMVVSFGMPAAFSAPAAPWRTKKAPLLPLPCTKITGETALKATRAQAMDAQPPALGEAGNSVTRLAAGVGARPAEAIGANRMLVAGTVTVCSDQTWGGGAIGPTTVPLKLTRRGAAAGPSWKTISCSVAMGTRAPDATAAASVGCGSAGVPGDGLREPNARVTGTATPIGVPVAAQEKGAPGAAKSWSFPRGGAGTVDGMNSPKPVEHERRDRPRHPAAVARELEGRRARPGFTRAEHHDQAAGSVLR